MKGQYFSFDAIIASVIFILALVALLSYWHSVRSFLDYQNDQLSKDAVRISNLLFTPPEPSTSCGSMSRLGFAFSYDDRRVNSEVIECAITASGSNEEWLQEVTGTPFNVYLEITNVADGNKMEIGTPQGEEVTNVVNIRRLATVVNTTDGSDYSASFDLTLYN